MKPTLLLAETDLPPTVRNLVRLAGWRSALALVSEMPGARIYCPSAGPDENSERWARVLELVGERAARAIYAEYRGGVLEIPNCRAAIAAARNRALRAQYDAGSAIEALCLAFGLSRRQVFTVLKQPDGDARTPGYELRSGQMGLF